MTKFVRKQVELPVYTFDELEPGQIVRSESGETFLVVTDRTYKVLITMPDDHPPWVVSMGLEDERYAILGTLREVHYG